MFGRRSFSFRAPCLWLAPAIVATALHVPSAHAQSAADKATARKLATEGIELYRSGKHADALDRLNRAQALYDAPVHLVYIARAQAKLDLLVEAAETYRRLLRVKLEPGAPQAFKEAIESGKTELAEIEPTIPSLRVDVTPANVPSLELTIDGEKVSAAVVGVDRPANPGRREIRASAPGYEPAEASVELKAGQKSTVTLSLKPLPGGGETTSAGTTGEGASATVTSPPAESSSAALSKLGFFVGLRLAAGIPVGTAYNDANGQTRNLSDLSGGGGGAELHGGVRFTRYFAAKLFVEGYRFDPGSRLDEVPDYQMNIASVDSKNVTSADGFGLGVMGGLIERGRFGGFGELSFVAVHRYMVTRDVEDSGPPVGCGSSTDVVTLSGPALRIGGGAVIPVTRYLQLTPFMTATFGSFSEADVESGCQNRIPLDGLPVGNSKVDAGGHQLFILGVGGDFLIGGP